MKDKQILKYIDSVIINLKKHLRKEMEIANAREKEKMNMRLEIVQEIRRAFDWGLAEEDNKQSNRILQIAKYREESFDVSQPLHEIKLYSKIREVIPYIQAASYKINDEQKHLTEDLLLFCENQMEIIDASPYKKKIIFPTKSEINEAFRSYKEMIQPNKIPSLKVYKQPEVNQKIEELYQMFLELAD
ncbi:hypothetical protein H4O18_01195 [Arenibacter sp. BSSL-BM3]|uniref:Uncharacterized protein n=1 Tax=Arenibacter arenosicollis TaxID=2762274 RepID=A0ABR7QHC8_9FLAO|nr:hypothetical protein [Arenibacter arenosicollis]MBC8766596.1 hypothetical protein [Arenibacter arenosicollis]